MAPVLAELMLLAITLVLGASLSGYFFGLLNGYSHTAEVSATGASCAQSGGVTCEITLINVGSENVGTTSVCTMGVAGGTVIGTLSRATILAGGAPQEVECSSPTGSLSAGANVVGSVQLSNGAAVYFVAH